MTLRRFGRSLPPGLAAMLAAALLARAGVPAGTARPAAPAAADKPIHTLLLPLLPKLRTGFRTPQAETQQGMDFPPSPDPRLLAGRYAPLEATLLLPGERGRLPSYTDDGARSFAAHVEAYLAGYPALDPRTVCKPPGPVRALNDGQPVQILQSVAEVTIVHMEDHLVRHIRLQPRAATAEPTYMGHSYGHWEGNTLVVETLGLRADSWLDDYGNPGSGQLMLRERYTKQPNGSLRIEATINDPVNYSEPVRLVRNWAWSPDTVWHESICEQRLGTAENGG